MSTPSNPLLDLFAAAPEIRPYLNVGCLLDVTTGVYYTGKHGESILNGGMMKLTGIGGRGNMYKSTIANFMALMGLNRYIRNSCTAHDSEGSGSPMRLMQLAAAMEYIMGLDLVAEHRLTYSDLSVMFGNDWFKRLQELGEYKKNNAKTFMGTTPFLDGSGKNIRAMFPTEAILDSISQMTIAEVNKLYDKAEIGESELNAEAMRSSMAKNQMLNQIPLLTASAGVYMLITAHVGDEIILDKYAGDKKKLSFLKGNLKFKATPEKFTFLTDLLLFCRSTELLINATTKAPEFPRNGDDNMKGDTDLQAVTVQILRNKHGKTGMCYEFVVSQAEGVHVGLTELRYLKQNKPTATSPGWGFGGHDKGYYLEIVPAAKMQRTTVRNVIDTNAHVRRALEITSEIHQIFTMSQHHHLAAKYRCTMGELYIDLIAMGYDWDTLLNTRGYWVYEEDEAGLPPFLSSLDLLKMRAGEYKPWWYKGKIVALPRKDNPHNLTKEQVGMSTNVVEIAA